MAVQLFDIREYSYKDLAGNWLVLLYKKLGVMKVHIVSNTIKSNANTITGNG